MSYARVALDPRNIEVEDPGYGTTHITGTFEVTIDYVLTEEDVRLIRDQVQAGLQEKFLSQWGGEPRFEQLDVRGRVEYEVLGQVYGEMMSSTRFAKVCMFRIGSAAASSSASSFGSRMSSATALRRGLPGAVGRRGVRSVARPVGARRPAVCLAGCLDGALALGRTVFDLLCATHD
jgi:hypothetical protein